jgi:rubrerythrin
MYPPDFAPIRKKTRELFETLLEKEYVPKEEADAERKRLGDQNTDLILDKLGKMEQQRRKIEDERIEVQKENDAAAKLTRNAIMMTYETALKLVADREAEGTAKSYTCIFCNSTFTIFLGTTSCDEPKTCPSCTAPIIRRVQRFR